MLLDNKDIKMIKEELEKIEISIDNLKKRAIDSKKVILICGPTCTGKTGLAVNLAGILETDIITLDSMQLYRGMDIGTDKYDTERSGIKQHMIDIFEPDQRVTVVEFRNICRDLIDSCFFLKKRIPVMAGGSGLYIRAVIDDLRFVSAADTGQDQAFRERLRKEIKEKGLYSIYSKLKEVDPEYAEKISINDTKRIIRALEVYHLSGMPFSSFQNNWKKRQSIYNCAMIGLTRDKLRMEQCIADRVKNMIDKGLIEEVKGLIDKGYGGCNSLKQAVGYKEVIEYLQDGGSAGINDLKENIVKNTKKLAKKQFTWFKADPRINWISSDDCGNMVNLIIRVFKLLWKEL